MSFLLVYLLRLLFIASRAKSSSFVGLALILAKSNESLKLSYLKEWGARLTFCHIHLAGC